jgi:hypothetical protein
MPKPATLPRWATDLTNNDAPSAGQANTGWTPGQTGVSDYDNYIKYWTYKWCEWLNGIVAGGSDQLIQMTTAGEVTASNTLAADLTVNGATGITVANNVNIGGKFTFTTDRTITIPLTAAMNYGGGGVGNWGFQVNQGTWDVNTSGSLYVPVVVEDGYRITNFRVYVRKNSTSGTGLFAALRQTTKAGGSASDVAGATASNTDNSPGQVIISPAVAFNHTISSTHSYYIAIQSDTGDTNDSIFAV